jgi:ATP-dependent 26S proteasome regulatory subunit
VEFDDIRRDIFGDDDDGCEVAHGVVEPDDDDDDDEDFVEYFKLSQHPRAKELQKDFDVSHRVNDLSVAEKIHFDDIYAETKFYIFFGQEPTNNRHWYSYLHHNIRANALYELNCNKKIKIEGFDVASALCSLKIGPKKEVLVPAIGSFVITLEDKTEIIIRVTRHPSSVEWAIFCKDSIDHSKWDKMFRGAIKEYNQYKNSVFDQEGNFIELPSVTFEDIFLDKSVREAVQTNIIDYINPLKIKMKKKNGIPTRRGIIFTGAPGVGKTFLSRVLANTLNTTFMIVTNLEGLKELKNIFKFMSQFERAILLFEDIDIYVKHRSIGSGLLPTMLNALDGVEVNNHLIVLCTTNDVETFDDALKNRPGRFDLILSFNAPSKELKTTMLQGFCKGKNVSEVDFEKVVERVPAQYTGAHLKELYISACVLAIERDIIDKEDNVILTTNLFIDALRRIEDGLENKCSIGFK